MKTTGKTMTKHAIAARLATEFEFKQNFADEIVDTLSSWGVLRVRRHRLRRRLRRGAAAISGGEDRETDMADKDWEVAEFAPWWAELEAEAAATDMAEKNWEWAEEAADDAEVPDEEREAWVAAEAAAAMEVQTRIEAEEAEEHAKKKKRRGQLLD